MKFKIIILLVLVLIIFLLRKDKSPFMVPVTSDKYNIAERLGKHYISNFADLSRKGG